LYELGIAQALGKPSILLSQDVDEVPFDIRHLRIVLYKDTLKGLTQLRDDLTKALSQILGNDRIEEARRLIQMGMIRASVAMLGVHLEHSLRMLIQQNDINGAERLLTDKSTLGMSRMVQVLTKSKILSREDAAKLRYFISIRNRAVHDLKEPNKGQAEKFLQFMEYFIQKYLSGFIHGRG
jgi:hypothetical protein